MRIGTYRGAALFAVAVVLSGPGAALASEASQYGPPTRERMPSSSRCTAECAAMEIRCEELEKLFPSCGVADICIEEKEQCLAACRFSAKLCPHETASTRATG